MMCPNELKLFIRELDERQTHQWRFMKVKPLPPIRPEVIIQLLLLTAREAAPILTLQRHLRIPENNLNGLIKDLPEERGSQYRMSSYDSLPRLLECCRVEFSANSTDHLHYVNAAFRSIQAVKQHALLHGREPIQIFDLVVSPIHLSI